MSSDSVIGTSTATLIEERDLFTLSNLLDAIHGNLLDAIW